MTPSVVTPATTCSRFSSGSTRTFPGELDVHVVLDNRSAHKSEPGRIWLADPNVRVGICTSRRRRRRG